MRIRLSSDLEERARSARAPMSVDEFLARFPEVPRDVRDEPTLQEYTRAFGPLLRVAQKPTPCMRDGGDAPHVFYMRLVNDRTIWPSTVLALPSAIGRWRGFRSLLEQYRMQPATFACTLVPRRAPGTPRSGCA